MEAKEKLVPGRRLLLADGEWYVVPPLTFMQLRTHDAEIQALSDQDRTKGVELMERVAKLTKLALERNYNMTSISPVDEVMDLITLDNMSEVIAAVIGTAPPVTSGKVVDLDVAAGHAGKAEAVAR